MFQKRYRHFNRYKEIANILVKHGFGYTLEILGLNDLLPYKPRNPRTKNFNTTPKRVKNVLQDLGPTFVKFGQIMSTRIDLLPREYIEELEILQDDIPPLQEQDIRNAIENELGNKVENIFLDFSWTPLASASIGQVHRAKLKSGEEVVVKVQRPGIKEKVEIDLEILFDIFQLLEKRTSWAKQYNLLQIVDELAFSLRSEVDYTAEGRNIDRFCENFAEDDTVIIPRVFWDYTTTKILVMDYVESVKISKVNELREKGVFLNQVATNLVQAIIKQIFIYGLFHSDPHPGNIGVQGDKVVFMDFGQVGRLDEFAQNKYIDLILALVRQDVNGMVKILLEFGVATKNSDQRELKKDLSKLKAKYYRTALSQIEIGEALRELIEVINKNNLKPPPDFGLLAKSLITVEGIVQQLDPDLSIVEIAEPMAKQLLKKRYNPKYLQRKAVDNLYDLALSLVNLPKQMQAILNIVENGETRIKLEHTNLNRLLNQINVVSNRIVLSIVLAAIIIGSSLIAQRLEHSFLLRIPIAEAGFIVALVLGVWLIISILRTGRY